MYKYEQYTGTHEFTKGKLERHTGGPGRIELQTVCWGSMLPLRHSDQQLGESTCSKLYDLDMRIQRSQNSPASGDAKAKWRARVIICKAIKPNKAEDEQI